MNMEERREKKEPDPELDFRDCEEGRREDHKKLTEQSAPFGFQRFLADRGIKAEVRVIHVDIEEVEE